MSESAKENLIQDILLASIEKEMPIEANNNMDKDSSNIKEQHSVEMMKEKKKKEEEKEEPQLPVSDSPQSILFHSLCGSFAGSDREAPHVAAVAVEVENHHKVEEGIVNGRNSGFLMNKKEAELIKILFWIRILALVLCMLSFTVMASDRKKGILKASFYEIKAFRYVLAMNVVGFVYCALQIWDILNYIFTMKHLVKHKFALYFSFAMDQVLTYLLLSVSVSAVTLTQYLGNIVIDEFISMANASIALSFLAFKTFALATLFSGYMLIKFN